MKKSNFGEKLTAHIKEYAVTYLFIAISAFFFAVSDQDLSYTVTQLILRLNRNAFIVLALIIPIIAGMGINFAITIGAMAAQIGLLLAINWGITGPRGILVAALITLPLGSLFGLLIGRLLNKMKGQETIGSMILGYFATGLYQLLFLFIFGKIIPMNDNVSIVGSTGIKNTLNLTGETDLYMAIDGLVRVKLLTAVFVICGVAAVFALVQLLRKKLDKKNAVIILAACVVISVFFLLPGVKKLFDGSLTGSGKPVTIPLITWLLVLLLCLFNSMLMRTRIGQKFRAVGQNRTVANASGINVDKTRIIAIMISTVLAGWGQIIFMQSEGIGTFQTYSAHEQVGLYAGAAILVGGASIDRASNSQALIGTFLFHLMFITATGAATRLFGDSAIGEYFRAFLSYGVIALALVMYAWRGVKAVKKAQEDKAEDKPKDAPPA
ncbi:MAG: ABC transporter permease [Oscillospiraceae bacterium]|nr:ABC transporter permease [Oscillospiraceae bacterium]